MAFKPTRRQLLFAGAGGLLGTGTLVVGVKLYKRRHRQKPAPPRQQEFAPNAFVAIDKSGEVSIWIHRAEVGQGVMTSLPMLIADELGADWKSVKVIQALAIPESYGFMLTAVSSSISENWEELRRAGASAREVLRQAAANSFGCSYKECRAEDSFVHGPDGQKLAFGELVRAAAQLSVPSDPPLKDLSALKYVGKPHPRYEGPDKVTGKAIYSIDHQVPGMLYAAMALPPVFGGKVSKYDAEAAKKLPGIVAVEKLDSGVAVVAKSTWQAFRGVEALKAEFSAGSGPQLSSEQIRQKLKAGLKEQGIVMHGSGEIPPTSELPFGATYELPYLAHATMAPMSCTASVEATKAEIWAPTQSPDGLQREASQLLGIPAPQITVHTTLIGGAFGRKVENDVARQCIELSRRLKKPIKVVWTRENDMQHDFYRPAATHQLQATIKESGYPDSLQHKVVSPSILAQRGVPTTEGDPAAVEGANELPYAIKNLQLNYVPLDLGIPTGFWRSVGHSHTAFAIESFVDELAQNAKIDPLKYRRELLKDKPRYLGVLDLVAKKARWGQKLSEGHFQGLAVHKSFGSWVAEIAEVSLLEGGACKVHKVTAAVDCGWTVNPDMIRAQIEGGIVFGLTAFLKGKITFEGGAAQQSNFHDYPLLRIDEAPEVAVHIVPSTAAPGGIGEVGVPPIAPAVANALVAAGQPRPRVLPLEG